VQVAGRKIGASMASPLIMKGMIEKKLFVKKASNVQGTVRIHFPSAGIEDIILTNFEAVNIFGRINITKEQVLLSNLEQLVIRGDVKIVQK
jgi:hypothetical protein